VVPDDGATAGVAPEAKHLSRFGPRVDEVAARPQLVRSRIEPDELEEVVQLAHAAVDVSDDPAHAPIVLRCAP